MNHKIRKMRIGPVAGLMFAITLPNVAPSHASLTSCNIRISQHDTTDYDRAALRFITKLKHDILDGNRESVANAIGFPITVPTTQGRKKIKNKKIFLRLYDQIFTPKVIENIRGYPVELWPHKGYYGWGEGGDVWIGVGIDKNRQFRAWVQTINDFYPPTRGQ